MGFLKKQRWWLSSLLHLWSAHWVWRGQYQESPRQRCAWSCLAAVCTFSDKEGKDKESALIKNKTIMMISHQTPLTAVSITTSSMKGQGFLPRWWGQWPVWSLRSAEPLWQSRLLRAGSSGQSDTFSARKKSIDLWVQSGKTQRGLKHLSSWNSNSCWWVLFKEYTVPITKNQLLALKPDF